VPLIPQTDPFKPVMKMLWKTFIAITAIVIGTWLYTTIWYMTGPMAQNIENALEAGVNDTVSQSSWLTLDVLFFGLVVVLQFVWIIDPTKFAKKFSGPHVFLIFTLPMATTSLTPLIGGFAAIFAIWICIVGIVMRAVSQKNRKPIG
jgi:hypothetical protein